MGTLRVRVVETLDMSRLTVKAQFALHSLHQSVGMSLGVFNFEVFHQLGAVEPCCTQRELQQLALISTLRNGKVDTLKELHLRQKWHYNLALKFAQNILDNVLYAYREHLSFVCLNTRREGKGLHSDNGATLDSEEVAVRLVALDVEREEVGIDDICTDNNRLCTILLKCIKSCLEALSRLKAQLCGSSVHLPLKVTLYGA